MAAIASQTDILIDRVGRFVAKHFLASLLVFIVITIGLPLGLALIHSVAGFFDYSAVLNYCGSVLMGIATLFVALIALYQGNRALQAERKLDELARRAEVRPHLRVSVVKHDNEFSVTLENDADTRADHVHLFEYFFGPYAIKDKHAIVRQISSEDCSSVDLFVHESYLKLDDNGFPAELDFVYSDVDGNLISQSFKHVGEGQYEQGEHEYV